MGGGGEQGGGGRGELGVTHEDDASSIGITTTCIKDSHAGINASLHGMLKSGFHGDETCVAACRSGGEDTLLAICWQG